MPAVDILILFLIFITGVVLDILWYRCAQVANSNKPFSAFNYSFWLTALSFLVSWEILTKGNFLGIFVYALGNAVGAYIAVKYKNLVKIKEN